MELTEALRRRRMVRSFEDRSIPAAVLDGVLDAAFRAPSAGFSQGTELVVLEGAQETAGFWAAVTEEDWRLAHPRHQATRRAPVVVVPLADPDAYLRRYSEPDKAGSGLGSAPDKWPVPYWQIDTAFAVMAMLLAAADRGLGALFMGIFRGEADLRRRLRVPARLQLIGAVVLGWPAPDDVPSASVARGRRPRAEVLHRGSYGPDSPG
ncbi:MAG TPA: nitroreductase family protein [Acidimicrobiales bacterium]|nr:nitroreductase family protein [Acidimicrobiales bacterium]